MKGQEVHNPDVDMDQAETALRRAAMRARETAAKTGTPLVTCQNGKVIKEMVIDSQSKMK